MLLMIDNYDSFTYNLVQYFGELKAEVKVVRNDELSVEQIEALAPERIVLSPGPCTPNEAGVSLAVIERFAGKLPLLGVCLGHQSIGQAFGGEVVRARQVMHGKTSPIHHKDLGVFAGLANPLTVTRYHSLVVSRLPEGFDCLADADGEIMAMADPRNRQLGLQFHPESILTTHGQRLLENALLWCGALAVRERLRA
ncbi:MAG: aminodeoxychorismate/anthranilate synthase component II [Pseudomonas aeruginosa]|nr:aminodeoxychorismate/anthranilate synthase component II [Pseudomonas aeruginosa]